MTDDDTKDSFEAFKKYKKLSKKAKKIIDTTNREHSRAYDAASELLEDEERHIDYEKLDDSKMQEKFAEKMADHYVSKAKQALKSTISGKDEFENAMLTEAYAGVTLHELKQYIGEEGKEFTLDTFHKKYRPGFERKISKNLTAAARSHLKEEHIPGIVKLTKSEEFIDANKLTLEEAIGILDIYHESGVVPYKSFKGKRYAKKEYYKERDE